MTLSLTTPLTSHRSGGSNPEPEGRRDLAERTHALLTAMAAAGPGVRRTLLDEVVTSHLWLADAIAQRFAHRGEDLDDLRQVARGGLVEACLRFDPDQGPFTAYASVTVTGLVKRHFRDHGWSVRPPRPAQELSTLMWRRWPEIAQEVGGEPSDAQVARALGASVAEVRQARFAGQGYSTSSLDALSTDHGAVDDRTEERCEARAVLGSVWHELGPADQRLLRMRFYEERSQADIAAELGTSQMQVSRLLTRVLARLRDLIGPLEERGVSLRAA